MERVNLTPERIRKAACPPDKQQAFLWDKESPRLAVRITAKAKSFIFEGKLNRVTIRQTIGACSAWTVEDARKEANRLQRLVDKGIDPREQKREQQEQKAAEIAAQAAAKKEAEDRQRFTLRALCEEYAKHLEERGKVKSARAAKSAFSCHLFKPHPDLAATPANEVTCLQITEIVRKVGEKGKERTANVLRSYLSAAFNAAKRAPRDPKSPSALLPFQVEGNPAEMVEPYSKKVGHRHLSTDELKVYLAAMGGDVTDQALKLALFSGGQRMAQLLRAKVTDYDIEAKILRLFDSKGARREPRVHLLPLGPVAAGIVANLVKQAEERESPFLLSSRRGTVHESTPGKRVKEISEAMGGQPFDLRDVRRTAETMLAGLGISRDIRAQLLSHGISGVQAAHYDRHSYLEEKRAALRKWERHLDGIVNGKQKGKVVAIR